MPEPVWDCRSVHASARPAVVKSRLWSAPNSDPSLGLPVADALKGTAWAGSAVEQASKGTVSATFSALTGVGQSLQTLKGIHSLASTTLKAGAVATKALNVKFAIDAAVYLGGVGGRAAGLVHP